MIKTRLGILIKRKNWTQLKRSLNVANNRLTAVGFQDLSARITLWVNEQIPENIKLSEFQLNNPRFTRSTKVKLPTNCTNCGGPVNPREVDWLDSDNLVCAFCGSVLNEVL